MKYGAYFTHFTAHPCFTLSFRVLPSHPCFTLSSVFYPLIRVLPSHSCFTLSSVFYPLIRVLPSHPCFTLSSVFYPLIRPSAVYTFIRSAFYPNPVRKTQGNRKYGETLSSSQISHQSWCIVSHGK